MGGSPEKMLDPTSDKFLGLNHIPGVGKTLSRIGGDVATGGLGEFGRKDPWYGLATNRDSGLASIYGGSGQNNPYVSGPFSLDPNQLAGDESAINQLGQTQSSAATALGRLLAGQTSGLGQTLGSQTTGLGSTLAGQTTGLGQSQYDELMKQLPTTVGNQLQQEMPSIAESANAGGVLTSSAYPQEIARQQMYLTQNLAFPAMQQLQEAQRAGLQQQQQATEMGLGQQQQGAQAGLGQEQAGQQAGLNLANQFSEAGLGRQLSLEDFINQANVAKTIGAQTAPQVGNGKGQTGTLLQGVGSLAPIAGMMMGGPAGAAAGAGVGAAASGKGSSGGGGSVTGNPNLSLFNNGGSGYGRYFPW